MLAVAGGAWALLGRSSSKSDAAAIGPKVPAATAPQRPAGPVVPGTTPKSPGPVAATAAVTATQPAATTSPKPAPTKAPVPTASPEPAAPVTGPQQGGTVTKKAYTFKIARGDTLWEITQTALRSTGRSTSNASTAAYVAKLYAANRSVIGSDPDLILVGTTVTWPAGL